MPQDNSSALLLTINVTRSSLEVPRSSVMSVHPEMTSLHVPGWCDSFQAQQGREALPLRSFVRVPVA